MNAAPVRRKTFLMLMDCLNTPTIRAQIVQPTSLNAVIAPVIAALFSLNVSGILEKSVRYNIGVGFN